MKPHPRARCANAKRYKGVRFPRCLGGVGCHACWSLFMRSHRSQAS